MARDHRRLRVFQDAHRLVLRVYLETRGFPKDEWFGLRQQIRRAAVSIPANIVEGNARRSSREYLNFLNISRGSAGELAYLVDLSVELEFLQSTTHEGLSREIAAVIRQLERLIQTMCSFSERTTRVHCRRGTLNPNHEP